MQDSLELFEMAGSEGPLELNFDIQCQSQPVASNGICSTHHCLVSSHLWLCLLKGTGHQGEQVCLRCGRSQPFLFGNPAPPSPRAPTFPTNLLCSGKYCCSATEKPVMQGPYLYQSPALSETWNAKGCLQIPSSTALWNFLATQNVACHPSRF